MSPTIDLMKKTSGCQLAKISILQMKYEEVRVVEYNSSPK
jgi:hypothetical protein